MLLIVVEREKVNANSFKFRVQPVRVYQRSGL